MFKLLVKPLVLGIFLFFKLNKFVCHQILNNHKLTITWQITPENCFCFSWLPGFWQLLLANLLHFQQFLSLPPLFCYETLQSPKSDSIPSLIPMTGNQAATIWRKKTSIAINVRQTLPIHLLMMVARKMSNYFFFRSQLVRNQKVRWIFRKLKNWNAGLDAGT